MNEATDATEAAGQLLARRVGLRLDPAIRGRLVRAVRNEAKRRGEDEAEYVARLGGDAAAMQDLLNLVTVQETSFFRDPGQFLALANHVLPAVMTQDALISEGSPIQVWSAGCANGQEAYSLAMVLAESGLSSWQVIATDISTKALARTAAGRYAEREMGGLSPERRARHFVPAADAPGAWEVSPALRKRVLTIRQNLAADDPPVAAGRCPIVFCRNVLIYFGRDDVVAFLERLASWLPPGGYLFLGYSESLWLVSDRFHLVRLGDAFVYRKGPAPTPSATAKPMPKRPVTKARAAQSAAPSKRAPISAPAPVPLTTHPRDVGLLATGEAAMGTGDFAGAVTAFRKATFMDPDQPVAHLSLGLALEAVGDEVAARRAFAAARAAIDRGDSATIESALEGYRLDELTRLLDMKAGA